MPKNTVVERPAEDVPIWDELVESGDPRPYEPTTIQPSFVVPDDAFAEYPVLFEAAWSELDREVDDALNALDDVAEDCTRTLGAIITEFEEKHGALVPPPVVDRPTAYAPALAVLDVESTIVLPVWPTLVDEETTS
jgi:hypothetical protein